MNQLAEALKKYIASAEPPAGVRRAAFVPELRAIDEAKRTIEFVSSTESVDRYGDILRVKGWETKNYMRNPVFLWAHRSGDPPIGKTIAIRTESNPPALVNVVEFADAATNPFADQIFRLYQGKFLRSVSVGFRPLEAPKPITDEVTGRTTGYEYLSQELLELSAVPIPANTDAVARAVNAGVITREDAPRFTEENVVSLRASLEAAMLELALLQLKMSVIRLEGAIMLRSLSGTTAAPGRESEIEIQTLDDLATALRG